MLRPSSRSPHITIWPIGQIHQRCPLVFQVFPVFRVFPVFTRSPTAPRYAARSPGAARCVRRSARHSNHDSRNCRADTDSRPAAHSPSLHGDRGHSRRHIRFRWKWQWASWWWDESGSGTECASGNNIGIFPADSMQTAARPVIVRVFCHPAHATHPFLPSPVQAGTTRMCRSLPRRPVREKVESISPTRSSRSLTTTCQYRPRFPRLPRTFARTSGPKLPRSRPYRRAPRHEG